MRKGGREVQLATPGTLNYYQEPPSPLHIPGTAWEYYRDSGNGRKATLTPFRPSFLAKYHF